MSSDPQDPSEPLKDLRDALRTPIPDIDTFTFLLSSTLRSLSLHPTSAPPGNVISVKSLTRYLPNIQISLLSTHLPTFLPSLDPKRTDLLWRYFVPPRNPHPNILTMSRAVASTTYLTLTPYLIPCGPGKPTLPVQSREFLISTLERLVTDYSVDDLYWMVFSSKDNGESSREAGIREWNWEEMVNNMVGLPAKVANAIGRWKSDGWSGDVPNGLIPGPYFDVLVHKLESLTYELSQTPTGGMSGISLLIRRLASIGLMSTSTTDSRQPSFWRSFQPPLLAHLHPSPTSPWPAYPPSILPTLFLSLPTSALSSTVESLLYHLSSRLGPDELPVGHPDERIKRAAEVLERIIGHAEVGGEALDVVMRVVLSLKGGKVKDERVHGMLRLIVAWMGQTGQDVIVASLDSFMEAWTDAKYVRFALYAQQAHLTHTLLLLISLLPEYHPHLVRLSHRPRFLAAMQSYLGHPDPAIRRLGMLIAEVVSERTIKESPGAHLEYSQQDEIEQLKAGLESDIASLPKLHKVPKRLKFGKDMWEGEGEGREEARWFRKVVGIRDGDAVIREDDPDGWMLGWDKMPESRPKSPIRPIERRKPMTPPRKPTATSRPKIVMLDDEQAADPLEGYTLPSPSSSRSPSPTPSYLEEVAADPSLALDSTQKKKVQRPVYISQLIALLKEREKPDHLEMALKWGEGLVRAKRSFGGELEENASAVTALAVALNDPFNLEDFDEKRQGLLNALVACSPRTVAPYLCETYFTGQYSLHQRSVMLTALAMGGRELAGMGTHLPPSTRKVDFPSKTLPPALHRKYISGADVRKPDQIEAAIDGVRGLLISKGAKRGEEAYPEIAREKGLRVGSTKRTPMVAEVGTLSERQMDHHRPTPSSAQAPVVPYKDVAAEYFVMPLINRFWQYFQDATTRESRAMMSGDRYRGAGTGMILSPMALEKFLMTLSLLLHAARHSSVLLAVLGPEAIELAVTVGSRHLSRPVDHDLESSDHGETSRDGSSSREGGVVGAALELALVALDASYDLDQGWTLAMNKPALVLGVGEWATGVFSVEEKGGLVAGGQGGLREGRVRAAAAAVVVKVSDIGEKWGRLSIM